MILSILCVTRADAHALPFLNAMDALAVCMGAEMIIAADKEDARERISHMSLEARVVPVHSRGYVESVLEEALSYCRGDYVLRLDDDERYSPAMAEWLITEQYRSHDHWKFATANLWGDEQHFLAMPPLWPDEHTRLSVRAKAGGRHTVHALSPFGGGELAPVILEHHKFLVKDFAQRTAIAAKYDAHCPGYGTSDGMRPFSLPETCFDVLTIAPLGDGALRPLDRDELRQVPHAR